MFLPGTEPVNAIKMCCTWTCFGSTSGFTGIVPAALFVSSVTLSPWDSDVADVSAEAGLAASLEAVSFESAAGPSPAHAVTAAETSKSANKTVHPARGRTRRVSIVSMESPWSEGWVVRR
jgi:hypothetical protein